MNFWEIIILLFVAGIAGSIGQTIAGYSIGGCFLSIILGFIGAVAGTWVARQLNFPHILTIEIDSVSFPLFWALTCSIIFSLILNLLNPKKSK